MISIGRPRRHRDWRIWGVILWLGVLGLAGAGKVLPERPQAGEVSGLMVSTFYDYIAPSLFRMLET